MKLTLNKIKEHEPCANGWKTLLKSLNKTQADDEEFDLIYVLKSNGIEDAVWCLECFDYLDVCLFAADVAESVLHIYESKYESLAPRLAIQGIRDFEAGKITKYELKILSNATVRAAYDASYAAGDTAYAGDAANAITAAHATADAADVDTAFAFAFADVDVIEIIFNKHFGAK